MSDAREVITEAAFQTKHNAYPTGSLPDHQLPNLADAILSALTEAGYTVVPARAEWTSGAANDVATVVVPHAVSGAPKETEG